MDPTTPDTGPAAGQTPATTTPPTAASVKPLEPLPALRTGVIEPENAGDFTATLIAHFVDEAEGYSYLDLHVRAQPGSAGTSWSRALLDPHTPGTVASFEASSGDGAKVIVRRPSTRANVAFKGSLLGERWENGKRRKVQVRFQFAPKGAAWNEVSSDPDLPQRWVSAMTREFRDSNHPWDQFAAGRLQAAGAGAVQAAWRRRNAFNRPGRRTDITRLMDTTTGWLSMQEALQHDRGLRIRDDDTPPSIAIAELEGPRLDPHPFPAMTAQLPGGAVDVLATEPLSRAAPADFWYARVDDIRLLLRLMDEADTWITPIAQILQENPQDRQLSERYQQQLGLKRSGLAKALGHTAVGAVAIVGSDPYLREGSDVTMIFELRQQALFDREIEAQLASYVSSVPFVERSTIDHNGVTIQIARDALGRVRQHRAQVGDLALISNSKTAITRVLDTIAGRAERLSDEADLAYMLARDPGAHNAFAFLSDKFIAAVISPRQKVLAARRQRALAELQVPAYAALLHGWIYGKAPSSVRELQDRGLLFPEELSHGGGELITFSPGSAPRSLWGDPSALTPLLDLPPPTLVTPAEKTAYSQFARTYQTYWKRFIDPVAIRLDVIRDESGAARADVDVRVLPLISATDYSDIERIVGENTVKVGELDSGIQAVWAVGKDVSLRRDLNGLLRSASGRHDLGIDWLGSWVSLGASDNAPLVDLISWADRTVQRPIENRSSSPFDDNELWKRMGKFPVYAIADVQNPGALVATLAGLRTMVNDVAPGIVQWGEDSRHREIPIVRIGMNPSMPMLLNKEQASAVAIYYAQTGSAIALAVDRDVLIEVLDGLLGDPDKPAEPKQAAPIDPAQFVFHFKTRQGAPIWTAILWAIQGQANSAQKTARRSAEILMRGHPPALGDDATFTRTALTYFGSVPMTAHGTRDYTLYATGAGDPLQGTDHRPIHGELPYPGSPVEALMHRLSGLRADVSFDKEPDAAGENARSLHTRFSLQLGPRD